MENVIDIVFGLGVDTDIVKKDTDLHGIPMTYYGKPAVHCKLLGHKVRYQRETETHYYSKCQRFGCDCVEVVKKYDIWENHIREANDSLNAAGYDSINFER